MRICAVALVLSCAISASAVEPGRAEPRFYVAVQAAVDPSGAQTELTSELRQMFIDKLKRRTDVAVTAPAWLPVDPEAMRVELARRGVHAFDAYLKVDAITETVAPLPRDPSRRLVTVEIEVSLHGNTLPDRILKIGGDGRAATELVIGPSVDANAVRRRLVREVADAAIGEAIAATEEKIALVALREHGASALAAPRRR